MTYVPTAYPIMIQSQWWIMLNTPSGAIARLIMPYPNEAAAESAISILGFKLIARPRGELHQVIS